MSKHKISRTFRAKNLPSILLTNGKGLQESLALTPDNKNSRDQSNPKIFPRLPPGKSQSFSQAGRACEKRDFLDQ